MPKKVANIICPHCGAKVVAYRVFRDRILVTSSAGIALGVIGGIIGAGIGIVTGGGGIPATIPCAVVGVIVGAGAGYIISDKTLDRPRCPKCKKPIDLGFR